MAGGVPACRLHGAELSHADLSRTVFDRVNLRGALLLGANVKDSGGHSVNLQRARLTAADFSGTYFSLSDFSEAQMVEVGFAH